MGVKYRCEIKNHGYFLSKEDRDLCPHHESHRHPLKVLLNPILRKLGFVIVSHVDDETGDFQKLSIKRYPWK